MTKGAVLEAYKHVYHKRERCVSGALPPQLAAPLGPSRGAQRRSTVHRWGTQRAQGPRGKGVQPQPSWDPQAEKKAREPPESGAAHGVRGLCVNQ